MTGPLAGTADYPDSGAMDAAALTGGPGTFLPRIVTGRPGRIAAHAGELRATAARFTAMQAEFTAATTHARTVWPPASPARRQIDGSVAAFERIVVAVRTSAGLLGMAALLVRSAQTGYRLVVAAVNPAVTALLADPASRAAAVALATSATAMLREFITGIEDLLRTLGVSRLGAQVSTLAGVASDIERLTFGAARTLELPSAGARRRTTVIGDETDIDIPGLLDRVRGQADRIRSIQREVEAIRVTGTSRDGAVTVTVQGNGTLARLQIAPDAVRGQDTRDLGDTVLEAVNDGLRRLAEASAARFAPVLDPAERDDPA